MIKRLMIETTATRDYGKKSILYKAYIVAELVRNAAGTQNEELWGPFEAAFNSIRYCAPEVVGMKMNDFATICVRNEDTLKKYDILDCVTSILSGPPINVPLPENIHSKLVVKN